MATDPSRTFIRLNKAIAQAGQCSRRKADHLIKQGRVQVNGSIVQELGTKIQPDSDKIAIDNVPLLKTNTNLSIALHKPVQVVATLDDPQKRKTVLDLLSNTLRQKRPVPVGRLDYMTEGLLLMSTDGQLIHRLTHPRWHIPKKYHLLIKGQIAESKFQLIRQGMFLSEGEQLAPVPVSVIKQFSTHKAWLELTLFQGLNRQIRRMCRDLDWIPLRLIRISQGPIKLGTLETGHYRFLSPQEQKVLRSQVGLLE